MYDSVPGVSLPVLYALINGLSPCFRKEKTEGVNLLLFQPCHDQIPSVRSFRNLEDLLSSIAKDASLGISFIPLSR